MKKLNKFCAILFAMLGVSTLSAQTDVTSTYLTNADFSSTDGWTAYVSSQYRDYGQGNIGTYAVRTDVGTAATVDETHLASEYCFGFEVRWGSNYASYYQETKTNLAAGVYTLTYDVQNTNANTTAGAYGNLFYVEVGGSTYSDASTEWMNGGTGWTTHTISFVVTSETSAKISLGLGSGSTSIGHANTPVLYVSHLKLTYKTFQDVTPENPVDLTSMVSNAQSAWTGATECPNYDGISMPAVYKNSDWTGDALSQTINGLPVGKYKMEAYCQAHSSWDTDAAAEGATGYTYLCANEYKLDVPIRNADGATTKLLHTFEDMSITGGTLKISVVNEQLAANWLQIYVKSLTFLGPDKTLYEEAFNTKYTSLSALDTEAVPTAFATKIINLKAEYSGVDATGLTLSELEAANIAIDEVLNVHEAVAASYASYKTLLATCESIYDNSTEFVEGAKTTYRSAIDAANTSVAEAETADAVNTVYNTLETARQAYVLKAYPINDVTFDLTFKANTAWANITGSYNAGGVAMKERYAEQPWTGAVGTTSYTDLPNGMYDVQLHFNASACEWNFTSNITDGDENTSVTANNIVIKAPVYRVKSVSSPGTITLSDVMVKNQTIDIAINNDVLGANWILVAHKSLTFKSRLPIGEQQEFVSELLAEANTLVSEVMNSTVNAELAAAIEKADAESDDQDALDGMITALQETIADAESSIADYEKIAAYIAKAKVFDESLVTEYETAYSNATYATDDVEKVRQELNVATADYVAATFKNEIALTDWSAESNAMWSTSGEHWDGTTGDGCTTYYDANGTNTTHTLSKTVTLTPGTYVFRGAGRSNTNTKLSLSISIDGIEPAIFNAKGNTGYGINVEGKATFDESATYARDDAGQGWEWEFIKFTLSEDTEVTLTATCQTTGWGWASFANNGLWMDDATYVAAYGSAIDAPLAEANALVNTLPMGETENAALVAAIAACNTKATTPAELNAQVDGLNTAVANANTWVATYNTAKADLVAALERFEADYNDAENGALDYMNKSRWATVITEAGDAAVAKDNQTDHTVLTAATADLVAALDAATVSVNEYAALDEAIKAATALAAVELNWGDEPFQRPESAKAGLDTTDEQAVYDAAEADGEGVTTLTEALNAAMDITLNVPSGDFYLTVATEGHKYLNKPVFASLGATGGNNPTGYVFNTTGATADTHKFTFEQGEGNNMYRISVEVGGETVYLTTGSLNGSAAGWAKQQIQGTTDVDKAATFKIETSPAVEGAFRIYNTVHNAYVDCQDGGNIYTDTDIQREDFAIVEDYIVSTTINIAPENMWSTCVLMFDVAELPEGLRAFRSKELSDGSTSLLLEEVTELEAYTPYILYAQEGCVATLTGSVDFTEYVAVADDGIALKGAVAEQKITEGYILQNQGYGMKFYKILDATEFTIPVGKCWLEVIDAGTQAVSLRFEGGVTGIEGVALDVEVLNEADGIYTIDGKRVSDMQKGQIYVVGGKKTINR